MGHEYAIHFPHHAWPAGRDKKLSPLHERLKGQGAQFGAYNGWERANWFARAGRRHQRGSDPDLSARGRVVRGGARGMPRGARCGGAARPARASRASISTGPGAAEWLSGQITGAVPAPGRIGLAYFADERARIVTEMSVVRHSTKS